MFQKAELALGPSTATCNIQTHLTGWIHSMSTPILDGHFVIQACKLPFTMSHNSLAEILTLTQIACHHLLSEIAEQVSMTPSILHLSCLQNQEHDPYGIHQESWCYMGGA